MAKIFCYLIFCLLIARQAFGEDSCKHNWFQCLNRTTPLNCDANVNEGWLRYSKVCNGIKDCPDGSDELIATCKMHPDYQVSGNFYCASGGVISQDVCEDVAQCWDKSDQLDCVGRTVQVPRGKCKRKEFECQPGECVPLTLMCDNVIHCSNGLDESIGLCYKTCDEDKFQCGNGICIDANKVCDNRADCVDGADELLILCQHIKDYKGTPYRNCTEPRQLRWNKPQPEFGSDTKYQLNRGQKYVWPNDPVHFTCPEGTKMHGLEWNVCMINGTWHHSLPTCKIIVTYRNI